PGTRRVARIGRLGQPTTHAAAAALIGRVYVIGGRGAAAGTAAARITAVDPVARTVTSAGVLASPRSDLAAVALPGRIVLAGGRDATATVATTSSLVPQ